MKNNKIKTRKIGVEISSGFNRKRDNYQLNRNKLHQ